MENTPLDMRGTILESIGEILSTETFIPAPNKPVGDGEIVIGTLNAVEKAFLTICELARLDGAMIKENNAAMLKDMKANGKEIDLDAVRKSRDEFIRQKNITLAFGHLLWSNIYLRHPNALAGDAIRIGSEYAIIEPLLRKGHLEDVWLGK